MSYVKVRGILMYAEVVGSGPPLAMMHGGPGMDHSLLLPLKQLADSFTLVYYDHRCNGRSQGPPVTTMNWENLTADAEALRQALGFERWAVLGHSFGGMVALEYALRYPGNLSKLILIDTGANTDWLYWNVLGLFTKRGYSKKAVQAARKFFRGEITPREIFPLILHFARSCLYKFNPFVPLSGPAPMYSTEAFTYGLETLLKGWDVVAKLSEINTPTLVIAGRYDLQFPPEHQVLLVNRIPNARLELIEKAGHNAPMEQPAEVMRLVRNFLLSETTEITCL
jgi:pimeloyl-ACP methyl ester carboxylesterase